MLNVPICLYIAVYLYIYCKYGRKVLEINRALRLKHKYRESELE